MEATKSRPYHCTTVALPPDLAKALRIASEKMGAAEASIVALSVEREVNRARRRIVDNDLGSMKRLYPPRGSLLGGRKVGVVLPPSVARAASAIAARRRITLCTFIRGALTAELTRRGFLPVDEGAATACSKPHASDREMEVATAQ